MPRPTAAALAVLLLAAAGARAATFVVAESGGDFTRIQAALDAAAAGDTVLVKEKPTPYFEKLVFPRSGDPVAGPIALEAFPGHAPVLDGTGVPGDHMVRIEDRSHVRLVGFEIRNLLGARDGSGVRVVGAGSHIEIRANRIHDIRGESAMGITVYGTRATPIANLVIDGNEVFDCEPAPSEAIVLNGNVTDFQVTDNYVHDVNNIGIDFIGGETDIQPDESKVARSGVCRGNRVERARSIYGGGYGAGIYVDGGRDIVIERNVVTESDLGLEVGAEHRGVDATGIVVRDNVLFANDKAGLVFGGYAANVGRVRRCRFTNNTVVGNDTLGVGLGELWIQHASDNVVANNVFVATPQGRLLTSDAGNADNTLDWNVWWAPGAATFTWNGDEHAGFAAYRAATGADPHSLFADPLLADPAAGDVHLLPGSPAIDAGDPGFVAGAGEVDVDGEPRVNGPRVDAGADEAPRCGNGALEPGELCDDGDLEDGDGCDSSCTPTGCGNGVVTAGEECDDGGTAPGDCCGATCLHEPAGSPCDDGQPCTVADACTAGVCAGAEVPAAGCVAAARSTLAVKDGEPARRRLTWRWSRGTIAPGDLGDPVGGGTAYTLCVYDRSAGASALRVRADAPAGGLCRGRPCWGAKGAGLRYADKDGTPHGIQQLVLKPGTGSASIVVKAKGADLPAPGLPFAQDPAVTVQLKADGGACWEASFEAPAGRNDATQYRDSSG